MLAVLWLVEARGAAKQPGLFASCIVLSVREARVAWVYAILSQCRVLLCAVYACWVLRCAAVCCGGLYAVYCSVLLYTVCMLCAVLWVPIYAASCCVRACVRACMLCGALCCCCAVVRSVCNDIVCNACSLLCVLCATRLILMRYAVPWARH